MEWETVIGLEIHAQLATKSKIFSGAATAYGAAPNTQACAVDLGLPGVLPVLNEAAVRMAIKFGLAIEARIARYSVFARKNYFYPDLPKGYQISQFELPVVGNGHLDIDVDGVKKRIGITRAHLEEDAGKSLHEDFHGFTGIDLNRAGTPLLEIVSEPDMRSAKEAVAYLKKLHALVRYLEICDGNMQEGSFRCDANVSVRPQGQAKFGTRAEIKNLNSFRFIERAINYEIERQIDLLESGGEVVQETRLYDADKNETRSMRGKEEANDYRYFPDPDLLPLVITEAMKEEVRKELPELPDAKYARFMRPIVGSINAVETGQDIFQATGKVAVQGTLRTTEEGQDKFAANASISYGLSDYDAKVLTSTKEFSDYFEDVVRISKCDPKLCANWLIVELSGALNRDTLDITECPINAERLAGLLRRIDDNSISGKIAKQVFETMWQSDLTADEIIEAQGLKQISDSGALERIIDQVIADNPSQLDQYRSGKDKVFGFFVGQVMKLTQGKANPGEVNKMLTEKLKG